MARYLNLPLQSNSSFQQRILNEIINAMNTIDLDPLPTNEEFLHQAQSILFAGTFLPTSTSGQLQLLASQNTRTTYVFGGGNQATSPTITVLVNSLQLNSFFATTATFGTLTFGNLGGMSPTTPTGVFNSMSVGGSTVVTQATLPTITQQPTGAFQNVTLTGSVTGTIGLIFFGGILTMNINIQVATTIAAGSRQNLIAANFANTRWQNFVNQIGPSGSGMGTLDQWIAGTNNNMDDVRACLECSNQGLVIRGVMFTSGTGSNIFGQLNVGDRFNAMVTFTVPSIITG